MVAETRDHGSKEVRQMKSAGWIALWLVVAVSMGVWAQCGCESPEWPECFLTFRTNETIEFKLEAPLDYFVCHQTSVSPRIFGWRVEAWDGSLVRAVIYPGEPQPRWITMTWDLYGEDGWIVPPGLYQIIVMSTDGDVAYPIRIVEACYAFLNCFCGCCAPITCDAPCRIPYGELYLTLGVGEERSCGGLTLKLVITFDCEEAP
jgi:hypothetical protein